MAIFGKKSDRTVWVLSPDVSNFYPKRYFYLKISFKLDHFGNTGTVSFPAVLLLDCTPKRTSRWQIFRSNKFCTAPFREIFCLFFEDDLRSTKIGQSFILFPLSLSLSSSNNSQLPMGSDWTFLHRIRHGLADRNKILSIVHGINVSFYLLKCCHLLWPDSTVLWSLIIISNYCISGIFPMT